MLLMDVDGVNTKSQRPVVSVILVHDEMFMWVRGLLAEGYSPPAVEREILDNVGETTA